MHLVYRSPLWVAVVCCCLLATVPSSAQNRVLEQRVVPHYLSSGSLSNPGSDAAVVFSAVIEEPGAEWLRMSFRRAELGLDSHLRLTGLEDGAVQHLHPIHLQQWENTSAYFNGASVLVELVAGPRTTGNLVEIGELYAGVVPTTPYTQCGPTDDRQLSNLPERARLLNIGCTAWMYNDQSCFASAGHCVASSGLLNVVQFNVPPSNSNGSLNHPGPEDQYAVDTSEVPFTNGGQGNDWGMFRVFPNSETGMLPYEVQGAHLELAPINPPLEVSVSVVGYGVDSGVRNQVQQISFGPLVQSTTTSLRYRADTQGGNSGSGVVSELTGEAVAIHTHGGCTTSGGSNAGTSITHPGFQAALADFCPAGGGGGISCGDIHNLKMECPGTAGNSYLLLGALFFDSRHNGKTVTFSVDGEEYDAVVNGRLGRIEIPGATAGWHEIELTEPANCAPPHMVICH